MVTERLQSSMRHSMRPFERNNKHAALQILAYEATSLTKRRGAAPWVEATNSYNSSPTVIGLRQVVSRRGDEVASPWKSPRVGENQKPGRIQGNGGREAPAVSEHGEPAGSEPKTPRSDRRESVGNIFYCCMS